MLSLRRRAARIRVTLTGGRSRTIVRWNPRKTELGKFTEGQPVIITDDGTVECQGCGFLYSPDTEMPANGTCEKDIRETLKVVDSDGTEYQGRLGFPRKYRWRKCGSSDFKDNLWIREFRELARGNPNWVVEDLQ